MIFLNPYLIYREHWTMEILYYIHIVTGIVSHESPAMLDSYPSLEDTTKHSSYLTHYLSIHNYVLHKPLIRTW